MSGFDLSKFTGDRYRTLQLLALGLLALFGLLTALTNAGIFSTLLTWSATALALFALAPAYLGLLDGAVAPVARAGNVALRGAEAAGVAGMAGIVVGLFAGLADLTGKAGPGGVALILAVQALAGVGIAAGAGLTTLLRNSGVELEVPAPPPAAPQPPQPQYPQQYPPQQEYPQQQQYPPQQYPPGYGQWGGGQGGGQGG
jgi:hypothetical protein